VIYRLFTKKISYRKAFILSFIGSLFASGAGINPAYFLTLLGGMFLFFIVLHLSSIRLWSLNSILKEFLVIFGTLFLTNIFWIFPLINNLFSQDIFNLGVTGFTNWLDSLSQNTSLVNVIRLQGAWDWYTLDSNGMPINIPYALNYFYRIPFIAFSFVTPVLALFSLVLHQKNKNIWYITFALFMFFGIFLSCGSHPPTGEIYDLLVNKLPFFSFFRSPWYIFCPFLTLAYAGLVALLVNKLETLVSGKMRYVFGGLVGVFFLSYIAYSYPLVEGKIFRPGRSDSFYVKFPAYVLEMEKFMKSSQDLGTARIFSYPDDQLEVFDWGYRGTESILNLFSKGEVIGPTFNAPSKSFQDLQDRIYFYLKSGEYKTAFSYFPFLGADKLFLKNDVSSISPAISDKSQSLVQLFSVGQWSINLIKNINAPKLFTANYIFNSGSDLSKFIQIIPVLPQHSVAVDSLDSEFAKSGLENKTLNYFEFEDVTGLLDRYTNKRVFEVKVVRKGDYQIAIEAKGLKNSDVLVTVDTTTIPPDQIKVENSFLVIGPMNFNAGEHNLNIEYPLLTNLITFGGFAKQNSSLNLKPEELPQDLNNVLVAFSGATDERRIVWKVSDFNPFLDYVLGYDYKYIYGSVSFLETVQYAPTSPLKTQNQMVGSSLDWDHEDFVFSPVPANSELEISLKLPANKKGDKSKTFIQNLYLKKLYDNRVFLVEKEDQSKLIPSAEISYIQKSPVRYEVDIKGDSNNFFLIFLETYSKDWSIKPIAGKFKVAPIHLTVDGYANGWYIDNLSGIKKLEIYYWPQNLFDIGVAVFGLIFTGVIFACLKNNDSKKKNN
jgi:hypothetical protein